MPAFSEKTMLELLTYEPQEELEETTVFIKPPVSNSVTPGPQGRNMENSRKAMDASSADGVSQVRFNVPATSEGQLDNLPTEMMVEVLGYLDLESLHDFRRVSKFGKQVVDNSMLSYRRLVKHAPNAVRALYHTGMAAHFTVQDVLEALYSEKCNTCGEYGYLLHLLSCKRCCSRCVEFKPRYLPLSRNKAIVNFGLDKKTAWELPALLSLPGKYYRDRHTFTRRYNLVDPMAAREAALALNGGRYALQDMIPLPWLGRWRDAFSRRDFSVPRRFMTVTPFPTVDPTSQVAEPGVRCVGCIYRGGDLPITAYTVYTKRRYLEHFEKCTTARDIWRKHLTSNPVPKEGGN